MTVEEFKNEIHKEVEKLPVDSLPKVLTYLKSILPYPDDKKDIKAIIDRIMIEDAEVLRRLAEYDKNL